MVVMRSSFSPRELPWLSSSLLEPLKSPRSMDMKGTFFFSLLPPSPLTSALQPRTTLPPCKKRRKKKLVKLKPHFHEIVLTENR
jgi:hypothetical protein